jgi:hypothetical protein
VRAAKMITRITYEKKSDIFGRQDILLNVKKMCMSKNKITFYLIHGGKAEFHIPDISYMKICSVKAMERLLKLK